MHAGHRTPDLVLRMSAFAENTKENGVHKGRVASAVEEEEDDGYLMNEQNDHLHNGENFASLKVCMKDIEHQISYKDCLTLLTQAKKMGCTKAELLVSVKRKRMTVI